MKMEATLAQKAINLALEGSWKEAIKANLEILKTAKEDIDALNRLARAYAESGSIEKAKTTAKKVLNLDPLNTIASKCLERWKSGKTNGIHTNAHAAPNAFLEESGKTKMVTLVHPGSSDLIASLDSGDQVKLFSHAHRVSVVTNEDKYIGRLPDDLSARLKNLIKGGNKYQVVIKSIEPKEVTVLIRETEKGKQNEKITSFPTEKIEYVSFTPPELVHKDSPHIEVSEEVSPD